MIALVTGGSSGMGLEFSRQLAARGYSLVLVGNRKQELADAAQELGATAVVRTHYQDLALPQAADELFAWCQAEDIHPDVLVNNAGMFFFKELKVEDLDRVQAMINLHVTTVTRLCILFGQEMKTLGGGYILNVSSMAARIPAPGISVYSATKAYLRSFGRSLSFELRPYGVGVTTVCPAAIATPLYKLKPSLLKLGVKVGLIGTPQWLVHKALKGMIRKRRVVKPGLMNRYLPPLIAILPHGLVNKIWQKFK